MLANCEHPFDERRQAREPSVWIVTQVHPQHGEPVVSERPNVAERLSVDELAEAVRPPRNREVARVPSHDLQDPADRRSTLMELARGVQEARPNSNRGGSPRCVAQGEAQLGEGSGARWRAGDIRLDADVASCAESIELPGNEPLGIIGECGWECVVCPDLQAVDGALGWQLSP